MSKDITAIELKEKLKRGDDFLFIDVREPWEHEEFNIGAKLVPLSELPGAIDDWDDWQEKEVVVHCKSGARSAAAKAFMEKNGFVNVRNLIGGVLDW
jgi:rhodanese-related sulfurtransferase